MSSTLESSTFRLLSAPSFPRSVIHIFTVSACLPLLLALAGASEQTMSMQQNPMHYDAIRPHTFLDRSDTECSFKSTSYVTPTNYDLNKVKEALVNGSGYIILKNALSKTDVDEARKIVDSYTQTQVVDTNTDKSTSGKHNSYGKTNHTYQGKRSGIVWRLLGKGKIFEKIALHPMALEVTRALLGPKSKISSYMANTVQPGMPGQTPHVDYPYYDGFFPTTEADHHRPLLSIGFMWFLTKYRKENGGTAARPGSQRRPSYPHDAADFYKHAKYFEGEPGDVGVFAASIQHGAGANKADYERIGIVQSMVPVYLAPYHDIRLPEEDTRHVSRDFRDLMALDHPYPMKHG